eukprot:Skav233105  [mRNA]  locus=scaffold1342:183859:184292:+ [translate_table: standard]
MITLHAPSVVRRLVAWPVHLLHDLGRDASVRVSFCKCQGAADHTFRICYHLFTWGTAQKYQRTGIWIVAG